MITVNGAKERISGFAYKMKSTPVYPLTEAFEKLAEKLRMSAEDVKDYIFAILYGLMGVVTFIGMRRRAYKTAEVIATVVLGLGVLGMFAAILFKPIRKFTPIFRTVAALSSTCLVLRIVFRRK